MPEAEPMFHHPVLGRLAGITRGKLLQFRNIPYGTIPQRFARATLLQTPPQSANDQSYDARQIPPASIQPFNSGKMDCKGNQLPEDILDGYEEEQSEDCLRLNITMPAHTTPDSSLPVLVFVHGGAYFIGAGTRPYYDPSTMCSDAIQAGRAQIFVSMNYRLGGPGFFHSPEAPDQMPANNGLHDQKIGFGWIRQFIKGFGGDPENITAIGQSAGGMSMTVHNLSGKENVWKRSIQFSGSLVTMPVKSPGEHQQNFIAQAEKMGVQTSDKTSTQIAAEMVDLPVEKIRVAGYVGLPCSSSELLPYDSASMKTMRPRKPRSSNLETQIVSSTTYDGGISYNLMLSNSDRKNHAQTFIDIVNSSNLSHPQDLLDLYSITSADSDLEALRKICQFESDIGFFAASLSQAQGFPGKSYLLIFDLGNPFKGPLPAGECATHTWDIVALLGSCENRLDAGYKQVILELRNKVIEYVAKGEEPWPAWTPEAGKAMIVGRHGLRVVGKEEYMSEGTRIGRLLSLGEAEAGEDGADLLWHGVCRRFLMGGK